MHCEKLDCPNKKQIHSNLRDVVDFIDLFLLCHGKNKLSGLEPISKMWIRVHGKAWFGEKAQHTRSM
jgi:hypothetical protein